MLFFRNDGVRNFFFFFLGDLFWLSGVGASPVFSLVVMQISTVSAVLMLSLETSTLRSSSSSEKWSFPLGIESVGRGRKGKEWRQLRGDVGFADKF